jgi:hypothetical protein
MGDVNLTELEKLRTTSIAITDMKSIAILATAMGANQLAWPFG